MKTILIFTTATAVALIGTPAVAQPAAETQLVVSYSDLDLSTRQGVRTLDRRIRTAVETACGPTSDADLAGKNDVNQCRADTLVAARAQREIAIAQARRPAESQYASGR